jgi:hypothetical protein
MSKSLVKNRIGSPSVSCGHNYKKHSADLYLVIGNATASVGLSKSETLPTNASYLTPIQEKFITMHSELQTLVDMAQENLVHMKQLLEAGAQQDVASSLLQTAKKQEPKINGYDV